MLDPLTEIVVRVLMPVSIRGGQFVVNILGHRKRGKDEQERDEPGDDAGSPDYEQHGTVCQKFHCGDTANT